MAKDNLKRKKGIYDKLTPYNDTIKIVLQHNEKYMLQNSIYYTFKKYRISRTIDEK